MFVRKKSLVALSALCVAFAAHAAGSVSGISLKPTKTPPAPAGSTPVALVGEPIALTVQGSGACSQLMVDTGEGQPTMLGNMPQAAYFLPANGVVTFQTPGVKHVKVQAAPGTPDACTGTGQATIAIAQQNVLTPYTLTWGAGGNTGKPGENFVAQIGGEGSCANIQIDWGDGTQHQAGVAVFSPSMSYHFQPGTHAYAKGGKYTIKVWDSGATNCGGQAIIVTVPVPPTAIGEVTVQGQPGLTMAPQKAASSAGGGTPPSGGSAPQGSKPPKSKCPPGKPNKDCDPT